MTIEDVKAEMQSRRIAREQIHVYPSGPLFWDRWNGRTIEQVPIPESAILGRVGDLVYVDISNRAEFLKHKPEVPDVPAEN